MSFLSEFKQFAMRGNVVDLAVGVIIGASFGKIVSSAVSDVLMPPIGRLVGNVDFKDLFINLSDVKYASLDEATKAGAATINYGVFINHCIDFVIVALVIFMVVKLMNRMQRAPEAPAPPPTTRDCPECLSAIPLKARRCAHCTTAVA